MKIRPLVLATCAVVTLSFVFWLTASSQGSTADRSTTADTHPLTLTAEKTPGARAPKVQGNTPRKIRENVVEFLEATLEEEDADESEQVSQEQSAGAGTDRLLYNLRALNSPLKPRILPLRTADQSVIVGDELELEPPEAVESIDFASRNNYNDVSLFLVEEGFDDGRSDSQANVQTHVIPLSVESDATSAEQFVSTNVLSAAAVAPVETKAELRKTVVQQQPAQEKAVPVQSDVTKSVKAIRVASVMPTATARAVKADVQVISRQVSVLPRAVLVSPSPLVEEIAILIADAQQLGENKVARVQDAVTSINRAARKAGLDIKLTTVTQPTAKTAITLREADDLASDDYLGYAQANTDGRFGGVASINKGFDWYAGKDSDQIADKQFDYQTAVTHELLHLLGLEDDFESEADDVMAGTLGRGVVNRSVKAATRTQINRAWRRGGRVSRSGALTAVVPEPAALTLLGVGGLVLLRRRR